MKIEFIKIRLTKNKFFKFGISLAKGEVRKCRHEIDSQRYQAESDSGVWLPLNREDFVII